jgi:precorrin-6B methylase 1
MQFLGINNDDASLLAPQTVQRVARARVVLTPQLALEIVWILLLRRRIDRRDRSGLQD